MVAATLGVARTRLDTGLLRSTVLTNADRRSPGSRHMILSGRTHPGRRTALSGIYIQGHIRPKEYTLRPTKGLSDQHRTHSGKRKTL